MRIVPGTRLANVTSVLALVVALGGTGYAASSLAKDSVTSKQVKNGSLKAKDFRAGQLPAGPAGAVGPAGAAGQSALTPLKTGQTVTGVFGMGVEAAAASEGYRGIEQLPAPLAADLDGAHVVYANAVSTQCPGVGQAQAGFLCLYPGSSQINSSPRTSSNIFNPLTGGGGASRFGFGLFMQATAAGGSLTQGSYAMTAP